MSYGVQCAGCSGFLETDEIARPIFVVTNRPGGDIVIRWQPISVPLIQGEMPFAHIACMKLWFLHWVNDEICKARSMVEAIKEALS